METKGFETILEERIGQWVIDLEKDFYSAWHPLKIQVAKTRSSLPFKKLPRSSLREIREGDPWGKGWDRAWFKFSGTVPREWKNKKVAAVIRLGGEACHFSVDGTPLASLSPNSSSKNNLP